MKCLYCPQELEKIPSFRKDARTAYKVYCEGCRATVRYLSTDEINFIYWDKTALGDKMYSVKIYPFRTTPEGEGYKTFIVYYHGPLHRNDDQAYFTSEEIMRLDSIPNWTPHNFTEKLATHLPFL